MSLNTLVIVPTYNERENLPRLIECLMALPVSVHMLVVDDNSPDGTGQIADKIANDNPNSNSRESCGVLIRRFGC